MQFPDRSNHHESITDMIHLFQLVSESSISMVDSGSHSDSDDTFCKSSPCASYDCHTPRSDYDSYPWEFGETPETMADTILLKEAHQLNLYQVPKNMEECPILTQTLKNDHINHVKFLLSGPLLHFPCFDNVNPILEKESNRHHEHNNDFMSHNLSNNFAEPTGPPPPPPPIPLTQWRVTKPQLDKSNEI